MKRYPAALCAAALAALLAGCTITIGQPAASPAPDPAPTPAPSVTAAPTPAAAATPEPEPEPTAALPTAAPDGEEAASLDAFLTPEQIDLYDRAETASRPLNGDPYTAIYQNGWSPATDSGSDAEKDGYGYILVTGEGATVEDYRQKLLEVFTQDYLDARGFSQRFVMFDGQLGVMNVGVGGNGAEMTDVPDTYRLVSADETAVEFVRIAHFAVIREGESADDFMVRRQDHYDYTVELPIRLVNTADGWRVDEFNLPGYDGWRYEEHPAG